MKRFEDALNDLLLQTIGKIIGMTDVYNIERDDLIKVFAEKFSMIAAIGTFKEYNTKEVEE